MHPSRICFCRILVLCKEEGMRQNNTTGNGGTCYGDSGGPNFLGAGSGETD